MDRRIFIIIVLNVIFAGFCYSAQVSITPPPAELKLDPFYSKYLDCDGIIVISSERVEDRAFFRLKELLDKMFENRPDLRQTLVNEGFRYIIVAQEEQITDIPEYAHMKPKAFWNQRARGFGGRTTSCGEENLLNLPGDRYDDESIFIHELAHGIHHPGLRNCDPEFQGRLEALYQKAMDKGLYKNDYASTNPSEYWAESVQAFFDCDRQNNWNHNNVNTRKELKEYDPEMEAFVREIFRITDENDWHYVPLNNLPLVEKTGSDDMFSKKVCFWDMTILGTGNAPDTAMLNIAANVRGMFRYRYDILKSMIDSDMTLVIYNSSSDPGASKQHPEQLASGLPKEFKLAAVAEDQPALIHDLALAAYFYTGLRPVDPEFENRRQKQQYELGLDRMDTRFDQKVKTLYKGAMDKGLWKSTPAAENRYEYFAYGVSLFYDAGRLNLSENKVISNREQLIQYDPELAELVEDTFKHPQRTDWRYTTGSASP